MGVAWTEEQQKVISLRDRNILVSAAAGSGKTAVLVQRILSKIMDSENPIDIDRLLIMTFTRAAAGEMRERISQALEQALGEDPENEHLQRQTTLIHTAQITTIDGFCSYVIRNYFHLIELDPGYRTADEGELKLLKEDVTRELLEDYYARGSMEFHHFVECYAAGKTDEGLKDLILGLYEAAMSNPYPLEWLKECMAPYQAGDAEALMESDWMKLLWESVEEDLGEAEALAREGKRICLEPGGPYLYEEALDSDLMCISTLWDKVNDRDFDAVAQLLGELSFARLSGKKAEDVEEPKKAQVKELREEEKGLLKELAEKYFQNTMEEILETMAYCREPAEMLVELVEAFMERFAEKKREKNILDFTDMEHFALAILMTREGESYHMTQAARELSAKYDEVLVDEYQDSNLVQELLTTCVSGWVNGRKNIFMVGDVKQSIYRFRLARPELFMEKYKTYTLEDGPRQRIDLHKNFRSRPQVLEGVNYIFRQIMGEDLGGITYDDAAALYPGAEFPKMENPEFEQTEVLLVEKDSEELREEQETDTARELEALAIAQRIRELAGREMILDKKTNTSRPVEYGDIVILLRTASGWAQTFGEVLAAQGIPAYTASKTGYFSALEVVTVLNYLRVCDNPLQDIPLAGVLRSPIVGCTTQELAALRAEFPGGRLYESVCACLEDGQLSLFGEDSEKERLKEKLRGFTAMLEGFRDMASYTPVHQLILEVLRDTGYGSYARAMPGGEQRSANLTMLVEKAMEYEKTSYRGLFNFVRYIEHLQKYEVDYGEVNLSGAGETAVQIMTIHKSKGLEFPIVFVAGMGKQFNFQDMNARLLIHPTLGLGADAILPERRVVAPTLVKQVIRRALLKESLGEELRVLYVAMTRAREKLILVGAIGKLEKRILSLAHFQSQERELLPVSTRLKARNYWDYVLPALARHSSMDWLYQEYDVPVHPGNPLHDGEAEFRIERVSALPMAEEEVLHQAGTQLREEALKNWDCERVYDEGVRRELEERFGFSYPYGWLRELPVKVSVSELKKRSWHGEYEQEEALFYEPDIIPLIPRFVEEKEEEYRGAARGTAYHRVMECLDYSKTGNQKELETQLESLQEQKKLLEAEAACVRLQDIRAFLDNPLGRRMKEAALAGRLFREQPFVVSRPASELDASWPESEHVLVQGIIDAYFLEGDEIVLVDYKTDKVRPGEEHRLTELYHVQLEDYAQALERMLQRSVKEKYIYSFTLGKEILL